MTSKNSTSSGATWFEPTIGSGSLRPTDWVDVNKVGYTFAPMAAYDHQLKELSENIQHLNNRLTALESLFELKLKQHEETVTLLVEAIKNATK